MQQTNNSLSLRLEYFLDSELLSLHPIFPNFVSEFSRIIRKSTVNQENEKLISITVYPDWIPYWFSKQDDYSKLQIKSSPTDNVFELNKISQFSIRITLLKKRRKTIHVISGNTYEEMKESFWKSIDEEESYPFNIRYSETDLNLIESEGGNEGLINSLLKEYFKQKTEIPIECNAFTEEDILYKSDFPLGKMLFNIFLSVNSSRTHYRNGVFSVDSVEEGKITSFLNSVLPELYSGKTGFLNQWFTTNKHATRVYITKVISAEIAYLSTVKMTIECYFCYNWVYELVVVPHLQVYESFLSGRWNEEDFRRYMMNNFDLESQNIEEMKNVVGELLTTPYWIDVVSFENIKNMVK